MGYSFDRATDISEFVDKRTTNSKYIYGTLIVYGDLTISGVTKDISCKADRLWVKGTLTMKDCMGHIAMPVEQIDADAINIENVKNINNYPQKIYADSIHLSNISGAGKISESEVFAHTLVSDNVDLNVDPNYIFGLIVRQNEAGQPSAEMYSKQGVCVWRLSSSHALSLKENGYLESLTDLKAVQSLTVEMGLIPAGARVYSYKDAQMAWESNASDKAQMSNKSSFSAGY